MSTRNSCPRWALAAILLAIVPLTSSGAAAGEPAAIAAKAYELRMAGQVDQAVDLLESSLAEAPGSAILSYELARARLMLLDFDGMHQAAEAAVNQDPGNGDYRYFAAIAALYSLIDAAHHGDEPRMKILGRDALAHLRTILETDPDHHEARVLLVQQLLETAPQLGLDAGDPEEHVCVLEARAPILGAKARCCLVEEARQKEIWAKVLADHPDDCRAQEEAAEGLIQLGELDEAAKCLERAMALDHRSCYGLLRLSLAYAMQEDWDRAIAVTQRYLETEPPLALKAFAVGRLGMIQHRMGDRDRGRELMEEARALDPHVWQTVMPPPREIFTPLES